MSRKRDIVASEKPKECIVEIMTSLADCTTSPVGKSVSSKSKERRPRPADLLAYKDEGNDRFVHDKQNDVEVKQLVVRIKKTQTRKTLRKPTPTAVGVGFHAPIIFFLPTGLVCVKEGITSGSVLIVSFDAL